MNQNLTTLQNVREWLASESVVDDRMLMRLIAQSSQFILSWLSRPGIYRQEFTEFYDGKGGVRQMLMQFPVLSVTSLVADNVTITASSTNGYMLTPYVGYPPGQCQEIILRNKRFCYGFANIEVVYKAGYAISNEAATVPGTDESYVVLVSQPFGNWMQDDGVTYADGEALTKVNEDPAAGEYAVSHGFYQFNAADADSNVLISYSYVPAALENACIELVGERYRYMARIGERSKSLGGQETASFDLSKMPDYIAAQIEPFRRNAIIC